MKYDVLSRRRAYNGFIKLDELTLRYDRFNGDEFVEVEREVISRPAAVAVVLYDPKLDQLVFVEQFRVGAKRWLVELAAGIIDEGDTPETAAIREVKEETGLDVISLHKVTEFFSSPGFLDEYVYMYCAIVDSSQAEAIAGLDGEHEDIRVHCVSVEQAKQWQANGRLNNAFTQIGMNWFLLNHASLKA